uniref:Uncharacterized protein n=1 Tax=Meloidogyne enterolobii TaxID=390850 RepID=A0A6V7U8N1_MELEN|nr:unnamed protein product [Meloidogyne enterolobii]
MAERLNHNIEDNWQSASLQQEDNCLVAFIWLVHVQFMRFERIRSRPIDDDDPLDNFLMLLWMQHS